MKHKRPILKGFTLLEMLVALALTGSVLVLGFGLYRLFGDWVKRYQQQIERAADFALLEKQIRLDMGRAEAIEWQNGIILLNEQAIPILQYSRNDSQLIRRSSFEQDTFAFIGDWQYQENGWTIQDTNLHVSASFSFPSKAQAKP